MADNAERDMSLAFWTGSLFGIAVAAAFGFVLVQYAL